MSDEVLSAFVSDYIASQPTPVVEFVWQGGEPTLTGLDFFKKVVKEQKPYAKEKTIRNSLQTNGTLLTDEWCAFLKKNNFMVGISLDGPREIHDTYRRDRSGHGTFDERDARAEAAAEARGGIQRAGLRCPGDGRTAPGCVQIPERAKGSSSSSSPR